MSGKLVTLLSTRTCWCSSAALESIVIGITMANKTSSGITASIFIDNEDGQ